MFYMLNVHTHISGSNVHEYTVHISIFIYHRLRKSIEGNILIRCMENESLHRDRDVQHSL